MAIKIQGTTVVDDSRQLTNISSVDAATVTALSEAGIGGGELASLEKSFINGESQIIDLSDSTVAASVTANKLVPGESGVTNTFLDVRSDGANYVFHDTAYDADLILGGADLSTASYDNVQFAISSEDGDPQGLAFNSDGTKMFITGNSNNSIYQYTLTTGFDISTASYDNVSFSVSSEDGTPIGLAFNADGTKMFMSGNNTNSIYQYTLTTGFDISTASYDNVSFSVSSEEPTPNLEFNNDGTKMFVVGPSTDTVYQYTLSTGFDLSTASYDNVSLSLSSDSTPRGIAFSSDGTKMFMVGDGSNDIYQYTLTTGFDLSTASYDNVSLNGEEVSPRDITLGNDAKMHVIGAFYDRITQYTVISFSDRLSLTNSISFASEDVGKIIKFGNVKLILTDTDGSFEIIAGAFQVPSVPSGEWSMTGINNENDNLTISGSTKIGYRVDLASYDNVSFSVSSEDVVPLSIAFNTDGTKMFMSGNNTNSIYQYTLTTGFDISTASYDNVSFSVSSEDGTPSGFAFNINGTKMFVIGSSSDSVYQYTLTTGFDISTASYDNISFDVSSKEGTPTDLAFSSDGTKMFVIGSSSDFVFQYTLITGFDLSTASYDNVSFDVDDQDTNPAGLRFNSDGTKMFVIGSSSDSVHQYTLTTGFDVSTASYDNVSFSVISEDSAPIGFTFSSDGTKMFVVGGINDFVYQYTTEKAVNQYPASQYNVAISKPLLTSNWSDINDITITDAVDDGDVTYSLSTDSQQSWSVYDISGNERIIARNNVGTWEINDSVVDFNTDNFIAATSNNSVDALKEAIELESQVAPYDLFAADYDDVSFTVDELVSPRGFTFNSDGTKMFVVGDFQDRVYQYTLSTGFDISTASYDNVSLAVGSEDGNIRDIVFSSDGTKLFAVGYVNDAVHQYTLTTAFDLSTASYDSVSFSVASEDSVPVSIAFNNDGTKMFVLGVNADFIYQYTLTTGFDISTASYGTVSLDASSEDSNPTSFDFSSDGAKLFILGTTSDTIYRYTLTTAFDLSTASYDNTSFDISNQSTSPQDIQFSSDGTRFFIIEASADVIYQYSIPDVISANRMTSSTINALSDANLPTTADTLELGIGIKFNAIIGTAPFDISGASYDTSFSVTSEDGSPQGVEFSSDGTKMFVIGTTSNSVHQYTLSAAFDPITASYDNVSFSVSSEDSFNTDLRFNADGTKMFVIGQNSDSVHQYTLSTGFNLSTASYDSVSFNVGSQDGAVYALAFNPNGTKMFVAGIFTDSVYQYTLSTGFDLTTASYDSVSFSVTSEEGTPQGLAFSTDGTKMFVCGANEFVYQYTLSTEFDLTTASYDSVSFSVTSEEGNPTGITFNSGGTKMFVTGNNSSVHRYTLFGPGPVGTKTKPTYSGTTLNHDTSSSFGPSALGTDYTYIQPSNNQVIFTALSDNDFKIKIA